MPFSLNLANQKQFWPLIDNTYLIQTSKEVGIRKRDSRPSHVRYRVICRFKRSHAAPSASQGKRTSSTKRAIVSYDVTFALLAFSNHYEYWPIGESSDEVELVTCPEHSHSLDKSDANKCNSLIRTLVGAKVSKGYHPTIMIRSLRGDRPTESCAQLVATGGAYLMRQDVINTGLT